MTITEEPAAPRPDVAEEVRPPETPPEPVHAGAPTRRPVRRLLLGPEGDPRWVRPALVLLLTATAFLYLWDLGASGWASSFYAAAVQAGSRSWKAFFFGSFDSSNFITVDKPPLSLWPMDLSARIFGVSSWSILVPNALEGVATVAVVYAAVRRWFGPGAGLLAGSIMALTPVAVLMFRFNNPDAMLTLLLACSAYAMVRALERGSGWWLTLVGALLGAAFLTKYLQAFLVLPALGLVYLVAGPPAWWRRIRQLLVAGAALAVSALWWPLIVMAIPAADRPYIESSQDNSLWNLIFGYNGFGRLSGNEAGSVVGGAAGAAGQWGPTGWDRLFLADMGGQISWLIPAALILLVAVLCWSLRASRTDRSRSAMILWGGWLLVTGAVFSFAQGIIHPYYTVALAPAVAAIVAIGSVTAWRRSNRIGARLVVAAAVAVTGWWSYVLLGRSPDWLPMLRTAVLVGGLAVAVLVVAGRWIHRRVALVVAGAAVVVSLAGPAAYALDTAHTPHSGAIPSAGPTLTERGSGLLNGGNAGSSPGGFGGGFGPGFGGPGHAGGPRAGSSGQGFPSGRFGGGVPGAGGGPGGGGFAGPPSGGGGGGGPAFGGGGGGFGGGGGPGGGAGGGLLNASTPGKEVVSRLEHDASRFTWVAATDGANSAAGYQLATDDPVMSIGGFNGTDPAPTLAEFERDVAEHEIHYYIGGGGFGGGGFGGGALSHALTVIAHNEAIRDAVVHAAAEGALRSFGVGPHTGNFLRNIGGGGVGRSGSSSAISSWVQDHYTAVTVDGTTLYDLTKPKTGVRSG